MSLIAGRPKGSDITLLNCIYQYPRKQPDGKYSKDIMSVLYRDNKTGEKFVEEIESPTYTYYITKDDVYLDHPELFLEKDKLIKREVPYNALLKSIAEDTDNLNFFYTNIKNQNRRANESLHTLNCIFNSDTHIEDHFRYRFSEEYTNNTYAVSKGYFDIEADTINMVGDFPELGECPVNAITFIDAKNNQVHTFLLRNSNNPLIEKFEKEEVATGRAFVELKKFIINHVGGEKIVRLRHKIDKFEYHMYFYDEEIALIKDFFNAVNAAKLDFMLAWNMSFDIPYLIERIKVLGYEPESIICPREIKTKITKYYLDKENNSKPAQRGDFFTITGYSVWLDQMVHYASIRKGQSSTSNKLDDVGESIAHVGKLDYSHITTSIAKLPYLNYIVFVFYNIMDTIVQHCIENQLNDINYVFNKCLNNNTRYHKCHRQSIYLTNRSASEFLHDESGEFIIGNNHNRSTEKPKEKYPGAMVGDPTKNHYSSKIVLNDMVVNLADNCVDYDYKSLYPSIDRENNMAPNTQIGRILIDQPVHDYENRFGYAKYARGGAFLEDLQSGNVVDFCSRWLHYGTYKEVIQDIDEFFSKVAPQGYIAHDNIIPLIKGISYEPVPLINTDMRVKPLITLHREKKDFSELITSIANNAQMDINSIEEIMRRREAEKYEDELLKIMLGEDEESEEEE